ncbi:MAG: DUF21 domain-containing protein [Planctomycetaceae bacterium]|nr:MAG: DUF21 domain-containing protein [Planctomycetaceae bacterium]
MTAWQIILPWLPAMAILLLISGLMSGSEAALFSLHRRDLERMKKSGGLAARAVQMLRDPEHLLSGILFWNLLVNLTYFSIVGIIGGRLEQTPGGARAAIGFTVANLLIVIFCSEMVPKSLAVLAPRRLATLCTVPLGIALRVVDPILPVVRAANTLARRLIWPGFETEPEIDLDAIRRAIDLGTGDAALALREQTALKNLVELTDMRADQCMRPRSTLPLCRHPIGPDTLADIHRRSLGDAQAGSAAPSRYLLVIETGGDDIVGSLNLEQLRPGQAREASSRVEPVCYVPWSASVSSVLDRLQKLRLSMAVVVNEFGDTIGVLSLEDILEQVLAGRFPSPSQTVVTE